MAEHRVGSPEWKLDNRTVERDCLQETVDRLQAELATARERIADLTHELMAAASEQIALQSDLGEAQRQLAESLEREQTERKRMDWLFRNGGVILFRGKYDYREAIDICLADVAPAQASAEQPRS